MDNQKKTGIILVVIILGLAVATIYFWQPAETTIDPPVDNPVEEDSTISADDEVIIYEPSSKLNSTLEEALDDLNFSLQRGDAELSPTYEEFMSNVSAANDKLHNALTMYEEESEGKKVSQDISANFKNLKEINEDLNGSLLRGDAELAPTEEEFYDRVSEIAEDFREALKKI